MIARRALAIASVLIAPSGALATTAIGLSDPAPNASGFAISSIVPSTGSGRVAGGGDVNGDGLADLVIGDPSFAANGIEQSGRTYVVFGRTGSTTVQLPDIAAGLGGFVVNGVEIDGRTGEHVAIVGDVNGDGLDDLMVGSPRSDPGGVNEAGRCFVVFGRTTTTPVELSDVALGIGGFVLNGFLPDQRVGSSVAPAGDVNGDGLDDMLVGAPGELWIDPGMAFVVFGRPEVTPIDLADVAGGLGGYAILGDQTTTNAGQSIAMAGDVNGDGMPDVLVGAPESNAQAGRSYVIFGRNADTTPVELSDVAGGSGGFLIFADLLGTHSGFSVSSAGDQNGDGLDDLLIGAPETDARDFAMSNEGVAYLVHGKSGTQAVNLGFVSQGVGGYTLRGFEYGHQVGYDVSSAGDFNGDGLDDFLVGSRRFGDCFLVLGRVGGTPVELETLCDRGYVFEETDPDQSIVLRSVSCAGDVNGDGLDDVIVGGTSFSGDSTVFHVVFGFADEDAPALPPCPGNLDAGCSVGLADLSLLLSRWGACPGCPEDLDDDGTVGFSDLNIMLGVWGPCP